MFALFAMRSYLAGVRGLKQEGTWWVYNNESRISPGYVG